MELFSYFFFLFTNIRLLIFLQLIAIFVTFSCNYDRADFYYADIAPKSPQNIKITDTNANSATITWTAADDSAYPIPEFNIYQANGGITNLVITVSNDVSQAEISSLTSSIKYSAWVQATNRAGIANSSAIGFTTP